METCGEKNFLFRYKYFNFGDKFSYNSGQFDLVSMYSCGNVCVWGPWSSWNCGQCCKPTSAINYVQRTRGICCGLETNIGVCLRGCNFSAYDSIDKGSCYKHRRCGQSFATTQSLGGSSLTQGTRITYTPPHRAQNSFFIKPQSTNRPSTQVSSHHSTKRTRVKSTTLKTNLFDSSYQKLPSQTVISTSADITLTIPTTTSSFSTATPPAGSTSNRPSPKSSVVGGFGTTEAPGLNRQRNGSQTYSTRNTPTGLRNKLFTTKKSRSGHALGIQSTLTATALGTSNETSPKQINKGTTINIHLSDRSKIHAPFVPTMKHPPNSITDNTFVNGNKIATDINNALSIGYVSSEPFGEYSLEDHECLSECKDVKDEVFSCLAKCINRPCEKLVKIGGPCLFVLGLIIGSMITCCVLCVVFKKGEQDRQQTRVHPAKRVMRELNF